MEKEKEKTLGHSNRNLHVVYVLGILQVTYTPGRFMNGSYLVPYLKVLGWYYDGMMLENGNCAYTGSTSEQDWKL